MPNKIQYVRIFFLLISKAKGQNNHFVDFFVFSRLFWSTRCVSLVSLIDNEVNEAGVGLVEKRNKVDKP